MQGFSIIYTRFDGRISRKEFLFGSFFIAIIGLFIFSAISIPSLSSLNPNNILTLNENVDTKLLNEMQQRQHWLSFSAYIFLLIPTSALFVQRLHDRNLSAHIYWVYIILSLILFIPKNIEIIDNFASFPNVIEVTIRLVTTGLAIYLGFTCSFLNGSKGNNTYGSDPLTK